MVPPAKIVRVRQLAYVCVSLFVGLALHCCGKDRPQRGLQGYAKEVPAALVQRLERAKCVEDVFTPDTVTLKFRNEEALGMVSSLHEYQLNGFLITCRRGGVYLFNPDGTLAKKFGRYGEAPGEFLDPVKAMVGPGRNIVVYDGALRRVTVFSYDGEYRSSFPVSVPSTGDQIGLLVDEQRRIIIHDPFDYPRTGHTAWVYSQDGKLLFTFGRLSPESEKVLKHQMITSSSPLIVSAHGYYFESDPHSYTIRVYDDGGHLLREFGVRPRGWRSLAGADFSLLPPHGTPFSASTKPLFDRFRAEMDASSYVWTLGCASGSLLAQWIQYGAKLRSRAADAIMLYDLAGHLIKGDLPFCMKPGGTVERYVIPGLGGGAYYVEYPEDLATGARVVCVIHATAR